MIKRDSTITVNNNVATLDNDIYLYKYDKNIQNSKKIKKSSFQLINIEKSKKWGKIKDSLKVIHIINKERCE